VQPVFESVETYTVEEFEAWVREQEARGNLARHELLNGRIVMAPPAGWPHGKIASSLIGELQAFVKPRRLGTVFDSSQGFRFPSGDVVEPDVSFVSNERWSAAAPPIEGEFLRVVPDFVVEIASPSTASRDRGEKLMLYAQAGVSENWIVDYRLRRVSVWTRAPSGRFEGPVVHEGDRASVSSRVIAELTIPLGSLFD
jgi:Uma2 family endonuclease